MSDDTEKTASRSSEETSCSEGSTNPSRGLEVGNGERNSRSKESSAASPPRLTGKTLRGVDVACGAK